MRGEDSCGKSGTSKSNHEYGSICMGHSVLYSAIQRPNVKRQRVQRMFTIPVQNEC